LISDEICMNSIMETIAKSHSDLIAAEEEVLA
jgi:hypothetical protein